jgi:hypothetical protein
MAEDEASSGPEASADPQAAAKAVAKDEIKEALQTGAVRESTGLPEHLRHLSERSQAQEIELKLLFAKQEHELRQKYARGILWLLGGQFLVTDVVFVVFAWAGKHWDLSTAVINTWLGATVVQVVGIVMVVTRHLFPDRTGKPGDKPR